MIRIYHNRPKCIGCNACVEADKNRWRVSRKDGKATLVGGKEVKGIIRFEAEDDEYPALSKAVKNCPARIIRIEKI